MMTPSNGNNFRVTGPLCGEFTGLRPVNSPHKDQWRGRLIFFFDLRLIKRLSKLAGDLGRRRAHYDVIVM